MPFYYTRENIVPILQHVTILFFSRGNGNRDLFEEEALEEAEETFLTVNIDLVRQCCSTMKDPKSPSMKV